MLNLMKRTYKSGDGMCTMIHFQDVLAAVSS